MPSIDYYQDTSRFEDVNQTVRDLWVHVFLYLRAAGLNIHQPGQLGQPGNLSLFVWYIADMSSTKKRHQMMLTHAVNLNVPDQHELVVVGVEHRGQHVLGALAETGELLRVGPGHPGRGVLEPVPLRVLADGEQDLPHRPLDTRCVEVGTHRL